MNTAAIERTAQFSKAYNRHLINPKYLSELDLQEEEKLLGERTLFLKFHRFIYNFSDEEINNLIEALRLFTTEARKDNGSVCFNDYRLLLYTIYFHKCLIERDYDSGAEFFDDYIIEKNDADYFPEVTSELLIKLTTDIIMNYTGEKKFEFD